MKNVNKESLTYALEQNALNEYVLENALKYVNDEIVLRDSGEELRNVIAGKNADMKSLKARFGPANIYNWMRGRRISRGKAIELCFALKLDIYEAEIFLQKSCGHDWFHLRNYKDIIFYFCILNGLPYETAMEFIDEYSHLNSINPSEENLNTGHSLTFLLKQEIADFETEGELRDFFDKNKELLGSFNNTAYSHFKSFFDQAQKSETQYRIAERERNKDSEDAIKYEHEKVSFDEMCDKMRLGIPTNLDKNKLTHLQQMLYEDVPNRPTITVIYHKSQDKNGKITQITRKPLIIVWMMANEIKEFASRVAELNGVLESCGMPKLDSKNPFDWIVLNSLESDGVPRMEAIVQNIFEIEEPEDGLDSEGYVNKATLHIIEHGEKIKSILIDKDVFVIGRNPDEVDYYFDSPEDINISKKHLQIKFDDGFYYLEHISTTKGTFTYVNDSKRHAWDSPVSLMNGNIIKIGNHNLVFES